MDNIFEIFILVALCHSERKYLFKNALRGNFIDIDLRLFENCGRIIQESENYMNGTSGDLKQRKTHNKFQEAPDFLKKNGM